MPLLFQKDWTREDGTLLAIPHVNTKNTSFLRHCQVLRKMGIKNYAFPLALYNPILKNVDVHDLEEDTPENEILRTAAMVEARHNTWYFLRECVRIYSQGGKPVHFRLDRGSCAMTWSFLNGIDYAGMQPRQSGKRQPLRSKLLSSDGWIEMGDVIEGMRLISPSGKLMTVTGVFPQGVCDTYRVTLEDGRSAECGLEHLWKIYRDLDSDFSEVVELSQFINLQDDVYIPVVDSHFNESRVRVVSVEYVDSCEHQCISVDHPDQLYITDDMIVTHNTVCAMTLVSWIMYVAGEDYQIGQFSKDSDLREENVKRIKLVGEFLPRWWLSENKFKDKKNTEEIYYEALKTHLVTMVAQKDKGQADLKARGASMPMLWIDELEFCASIGISYPTMLASTGTARENARMNGKPYSNIITTTAGDPSRQECRDAAKILAGAMPFTEHLYDIESQEKLHEIVKANSPQMMIIGVFSHLQLGYDNEWLRDKITRNSMTREQVMRDYLNRRVSIQETPVIPKETLALITSSEIEPKHIEIMNGRFVVYWYVDKEVVTSPSFKQRPIIVGCDSSEMIGRDATTMVGIDPRDLSVVFTFRANEGNLNVVGAIIAQLLIQYPAMVFVPENKSSGTGFIDTVSLLLRKENHNPFKRMFNWIVNNRHEEEFAKYDIRDMSLLDTSAKKYFGIKTDKSKREQLYSNILLTAVKMAPTRVRDKTLIAELQALVVKNGRVDHEAGSHDDSVIAYLMAMFFILNAKNLDVYGIKPGTIFSAAPPTADRDQRVEALRQEKIQNRIDELLVARRRQMDPALRALLDKDLGLLQSLQEKHSVPTNITADDLHRNPKKFIDQEVSAANRTPVTQEEVTNSIRSIFNFGQ